MNPIEWSDDELDEDEYPDEVDDSDAVDTLPCPECGAEVYEQAEQCPVCGSYVTFNTNPWQGKTIAWIVLGLLGTVALFWALISGAW